MNLFGTVSSAVLLGGGVISGAAVAAVAVLICMDFKVGVDELRKLEKVSMVQPEVDNSRNRMMSEEDRLRLDIRGYILPHVKTCGKNPYNSPSGQDRTPG